MEGRKIEWASDTFNPWEGCVKVSAGCKNCYAETRANRLKTSVWGPPTAGGTRVVRSESYWKEPVRWNREASWCGNVVCKCAAAHRTDDRCACGLAVDRPRVFCASLADIFEQWPGFMLHSDGDPLYVCTETGAWRTMENMRHGPNAYMPLRMGDVRKRVFDLIRETPRLDWLLVTKRPENIPGMMPGYAIYANNELTGEPLRPPQPWPNVWLLASVEDQDTADRRIPELRKVPAAVRGLSIEPLLGEIVFRHTWYPGGRPATAHGADALRIMRDQGAGIDWVIVGGESGAKARGCNVAAVRLIVEQCRQAGVPVFVKQLGANPYDPTRAAAVPGATTPRALPVVEEDVTTLAAVLDAMGLSLHDPKGGAMYEWPEDLRVREFPKPSFEQWAFSMNTGA